MVYQLSLNLLGDHNEALDLSQEVFLRVFRTIHDLPRPVRAAHLDLPHRRQPGAEPAALVAAAPPLAAGVARRAHPRPRRASRADDGGSPDRVLGQKEDRGAVRTALDQLPFDQRTALVLREIDGLSYEEIGFSLGIAVGTVKSRLARARESLRTELRDVMTLLTCAAVRPTPRSVPRSASLPVGEQIAVEAHVYDCPPCAQGAEGPAGRRRRTPSGGCASALRRLDRPAVRRHQPNARRSARIVHRAGAAAVRGHAPGVDCAGVDGRDVHLRRRRPEHAALRVARAERLAGRGDRRARGAARLRSQSGAARQLHFIRVPERPRRRRDAGHAGRERPARTSSSCRCR